VSAEAPRSLRYVSRSALPTHTLLILDASCMYTCDETDPLSCWNEWECRRDAASCPLPRRSLAEAVVVAECDEARSLVMYDEPLHLAV
jgi:hypothetical protein